MTLRYSYKIKKNKEGLVCTSGFFCFATAVGGPKQKKLKGQLVFLFVKKKYINLKSGYVN